jgi:hypothetical protein
MKCHKKFGPFGLGLAAAVLMAGLMGGWSLLTNTTKTVVAAPAPVQPNCNAVTITNVSSQSVAAGQGEKITVDWAFNDNGNDCLKVDGFEVFIEVTRSRSDRKNTRKLDVSSTARSASATFSEVGIGNLSDKIVSARAIVTAKLANAKGEKTQTGL